MVLSMQTAELEQGSEATKVKMLRYLAFVVGRPMEQEVGVRGESGGGYCGCTRACNRVLLSGVQLLKQCRLDVAAALEPSGNGYGEK